MQKLSTIALLPLLSLMSMTHAMHTKTQLLGALVEIYASDSKEESSDATRTQAAIKVLISQLTLIDKRCGTCPEASVKELLAPLFPTPTLADELNQTLAQDEPATEIKLLKLQLATCHQQLAAAEEELQFRAESSHKEHQNRSFRLVSSEMSEDQLPELGHRTFPTLSPHGRPEFMTPEKSPWSPQGKNDH